MMEDEYTKEEEDEYKNEEFRVFNNDFGELRTIYGTNRLEIESIEDSISQNSEMSESKIEKMTKYFIKNKLKVGFISGLEVYGNSRGKGEGTKLMNQFKDKIMNNSDVDILLARTNKEQAEGFVLEKFYEKYGFKGIVLEDGDLLMVTKGYDIILEEVLGLKAERKMALDYYDKNKVTSQKTEDMLTFMKKKIKEQELINPTKKRKI